MNAKNVKPQLFHPLSGSNVTTLLTLLASNGSIPFDRWPQVAVVLSATLLRWPFSTAERWATDRLIRKMPPMLPPIFILGHWRSGTTHLYNILAKSPEFGFLSPLPTGLPWDMLGLVRFLRPLLEKTLPSDRFIDRIPVKPNSPQEDEIAIANMLPLSFYHGLYFPKRFEEHFKKGVFFDGCTTEEIEAWKQTFLYFSRKLSIEQKGKRLLIKNPVYAARVSLLQEIFPAAKFVHIHRDPYRIFYSMRHFYDRLFEKLALQRFDDVDIEQCILETYPRMMNALLKDTAGLPTGDFVEVGFSELENNPLGAIAKIYNTLNIDGFEAAKPYFASYLDSVRGYKKNTYSLTPETIEKIRDRWQPFIDRWGVEPSVQSHR